MSSGDSTETMDSDMMEEQAESMDESMDSMDKSEEERGPVPGSDEDFYSLGDRVFFDLDKFSLKAARASCARAPGRLAEHVRERVDHHRGSLRRARNA